MIRGIRRRFMRIAIAVLALAMVLVAVIINGANWVNVRGELYQTLGYLREWNAERKDFQRSPQEAFSREPVRPFLRTSVRRSASLWDREMGIGISSGVSLHA